MNWKQFFQDDTGAFSAYRLAFIVWTVVFAFLVTYLSISKGGFPELTSSYVALYSSVIGGKVVQSFSENFSGPKTP